MQPDVIRVFIGLDQVEEVAYHVLAESIIRQTSQPVSITPIALHQLPQLTREWDARQSNEFAFSRFLVPWMCGMNGWAIWMDSDMLCLDDLAKLWRLRNPKYAVQVVKHSWNPEDGEKFLGRPQSHYPELENGESRKLWSAMMLMNCRECWKLTPQYVNSHNGLHLHQFQWLPDRRIGELPRVWQHVVDVEPYDPAAKLVHWTLGGPWWQEFRNAGGAYSIQWRRWKERLLHATQAIDLVETGTGD